AGEAIHADTLGKIQPRSLGGNNYVMPVVDVVTGFAFFNPLKLKSDGPDNIKNCIAHINTQLNIKVKEVGSDNAGEFTSNDFVAFMKEKGIVPRNPPPRTSQQNGIAERFIGVLQEAIRTLLYSRPNIPKFLWAE